MLSFPDNAPLANKMVAMGKYKPSALTSVGKPGSLAKNRFIPSALLVPLVSKLSIKNVKGKSGSEFHYSTPHPITGEVCQGLRLNPDKISVTASLPRQEIFRQMERDTQSFIFNAVVGNTQVTYASAQKPFLRWCMYCGTNPLMTIIPPEWEESAPHNLSFVMSILTGFLSYMVNDNEGEPVSAGSAENYLSAVRKLLEDSGVDVSFMKNNAILRATKKGIKNEWTAIPGNSKASRATYCATIDMIEATAKEVMKVDEILKTGTIKELEDLKNKQKSI
jgi:hypothetical protein